MSKLQITKGQEMKSTKGLDPLRHDEGVYRVSPELNSRELLELALSKLEQERDLLMEENPAPPGEWLQWMGGGKSPQIRWIGANGKTRSKSITQVEAAERSKREFIRDRVSEKSDKIRTVKMLLGEW